MREVEDALSEYDENDLTILVCNVVKENRTARG